MQVPILGARRLIGRDHLARVRRGGIDWELDLREGIDFSIYLLGSFEPETVAAYSRIVEPGMTVVDIGANSGAHTLHLANLVGENGHVIAFEPTNWAAAKLRRNLSLNPVLESRVTVLQTMLTDDDDTEVPDAIHSSWPLAAGDDVHPELRARAMSTSGATARTLDAVLAESDATTVGFVKLDVDGYECQVLGGMLETLRDNRPPILMEFSPYGYEEKGGSLERLVELLRAVDYRLFRLGSKLPLPSDVDSLAKLSGRGAGFNVVALSDAS